MELRPCSTAIETRRLVDNRMSMPISQRIETLRWLNKGCSLIIPSLKSGSFAIFPSNVHFGRMFIVGLVKREGACEMVGCSVKHTGDPVSALAMGIAMVVCSFFSHRVFTAVIYCF